MNGPIIGFGSEATKSKNRNISLEIDKGGFFEASNLNPYLPACG